MVVITPNNQTVTEGVMVNYYHHGIAKYGRVLRVMNAISNGKTFVSVIEMHNSNVDVITNVAEIFHVGDKVTHEDND